MHRRDLLLSLGATLATGRLLGRPVDELWRIGAGINGDLAATPPQAAGPLGPFSARENQLVLTIAEHILPRSDTPGARDARVNEFIAVIVGEWYAGEDRTRFLEGLAEVDRESQARFGAGFLEAVAARQEELLRGLDAEAAALRRAGQDTGKVWWATMKSLTLYGYFTSELVQTEVLRSPVIPGRFDGCVAM